MIIRHWPPARLPYESLRHAFTLRTRPPPPPYFSGGKQKPPPYPGRTSSVGAASSCSTPLPSSFVPQSASTPKSDKGSPVKEIGKPSDQVVGEGERRTFVREKVGVLLLNIHH
ncbi:hypothetical protein COOONC_18000 [Cooperia oncophora]